jgi:hypothetical protein
VCFRGRIKQIWSNKQISSTEFDLICNLILSLKHTKLNPSPQPIAAYGGAPGVEMHHHQPLHLAEE